MKKQVLAGALSLSMLITPAMPVWAAEALDEQTNTAIVANGDEAQVINSENQNSVLVNEDPDVEKALSGSCGATEADEVTWQLVKNTDQLYKNVAEDGTISYSATAEEGYEAVDAYTLTISGEGNIADYYGKNITIDSFEGDIAPWRRALLSDIEADRTTQEVVPITKVIVEDGITGIGTDAFSYLALNGTITFNENVTYYGSGVYSYCPLITTVDFTNFKPKNVSDYWIPGHEMLTGSAVPYGFFDKDKSLNTCIVDGKTYTGELALPERIDTICTAAFRGTGFDTINFDNGLKDIKEVGPYGMSNLANIDTFTYPGNVDFYSGESPNGGKTSSAVLTGSDVKTLIIRKDVKELPDAFAYQLKELKKVIFNGEEVESIGSNAFGGCEKLESVELGKVKSMGKGVFINCPSLKSLKIEGDENLVLSSDTVASWGTNWPGAAPLETFELGAGTINFNLNGKKDTLKEVKLGDGVKDIPDYFLSGCTKLETLEIGNGITKIGNRAFQQTNITSIAIPDSVTVIGEQAFNGCTSLTEVNIPKNSKLETIGNRAFRQTNITSIAIPDSVTAIGVQAFNKCTSLTEVNISKNSKLETIGEGAFYDTRVLKMYLPGGVKTLGVGAFQRTPVEIYDMSDVYSSDFTIGDWCINNWYDTKNGEVAPEWANKHKDIYVNNNDILNALLADKKAGSVTKTCYVTNGGTVDMNKTGFDAVSREGYTVEWHKQADFSDEAYTGDPKNGQSYYAKWTLTDSANAVEVTYEPNFANGTAKTFAASKSEAHQAKDNLFSLNGYSIVSWNTKADGTGTSYAIGAEIPTDANITVYAQWQLNAPTVTVTGNPQKTYDGEDVTLTAASKVEGVTYQWQKDGADIEGATSASYTVKNVADSGSYTVKITDADGKTAVSEAVTVSIAKAKLTAEYVDETINYGRTPDLKVEVSGFVNGETAEKLQEIGEYTAPKVENAPTKVGKHTLTPANGSATNYDFEYKDGTLTILSTALPGGAAQTEFGITAPKADNGSIGISQKEASAGTTIIVSLTPAEGYKAGSLTVTDKNGNKLTLKSAGENKYTFTMPNSAVDIKANFVKADGSSTVDPKTAIIMQIGNKSVNAYGKTIASDVAPLIINSRTMVPIRIVTETLGGSADWNGKAQVVTLNINGKTITMKIGVVLEKYGVAPLIIDNRTYVPIRFVAEELGATVDWNADTQEIVIRK